MEILLKDFFEYKILIVDDLASMRENLNSVLRELGFKHTQDTSDGREGMEHAVDKARFDVPYDLIFVDIHMPVMDGITLLKHLRSMDSYKKTPIFMVSTENEKDIIIKSILNGATDYILKPYDINLVNKKLITVLAKQ